jgi:hypothetical protein
MTEDQSVYVWLVECRKAYKLLAGVGDQFKTAKEIAEQRMAAAPSIRDEIVGLAATVNAIAASGGGSWWNACKALHSRDIDRVENPTRGSAAVEETRDVRPAKREM